MFLWIAICKLLITSSKIFLKILNHHNVNYFSIIQDVNYNHDHFIKIYFLSWSGIHQLLMDECPLKASVYLSGWIIFIKQSRIWSFVKYTCNICVYSATLSHDQRDHSWLHQHFSLRHVWENISSPENSATVFFSIL